ncbi:MAG: phage holin family protein [Christensenellales bacterium]|jgi:hypothetical protein
MDWNLVTDLIRPELLVVGGFLYSLGAFLKLLPTLKANWAIPYILLGVSIVVTPLYMALVLKVAWSVELLVSGFIQAVILAALCVFTNQLYVQIREKRLTDTQQAPTDMTYWED